MMKPLCCCALLWNSGRTQQMQAGNLVERRLSGYSGEAACPKAPQRSHLWAPKVSSSFIIGPGGSEVGLSSSGVWVSKKKKKLAREELGRELGNSFSHIVQISSSAESESTVWKLTSDEGPESGGSKSAPTLSWWNTILLTGQFQSPDTGKRLVWTGSRGHGVGSAPSTLLNSKCYSLILSVLSPTSSIIHRRWLSLSFQTFEM